jgi:hypothetical protein
VTARAVAVATAETAATVVTEVPATPSGRLQPRPRLP